MSNLIVVSIRDSKVDSFQRPFFVPHIGYALRSFEDEVKRNASDNAMYNHPEDYELFKIGEYNEREGEMIAQKPQSLARALDFRTDLGS